MPSELSTQSNHEEPAVELNWSTFALEILNFLVLMFVLKHFFYRPVLNVINRRQSQIQQQISESQQREQDAKVLQARYRQRLDDWETEKQQAHKTLHDEISHERQRLLNEVEQDMERAREKARTLAAREWQDERQQVHQRAYDQASTFAARLLTRLASPELEAQIIEVVLADLAELPKAQVDALIKAGRNDRRAIVITTAYPLGAEQRRRLQTMLHTWLPERNCDFRQSSSLLAGVRIEMGAWRLEANLVDELRYFSQHSQFIQDDHNETQ